VRAGRRHPGQHRRTDRRVGHPVAQGLLRPYFNRAGDERKDLVFIRVATFVAGIVPIGLALYAHNVLAVTFLAKSLRAALAVLIVLMFYRPGFGSRRAAVIAILASLVTTTGWFLAGDPFNVDNAYIAVATP